MISIYLKTHNITGLKYLGKTEGNPFTYKGSGKYWKRHIEKYGHDISTEILFQSEDPEEIKKEGIRLSKKFNIVESEDFANLRPEQGDGGGFSYIWKKLKENPEELKKFRDKVSVGVKEAHQKGKLKGWKEAMKGKPHGFLGKKHSIETRMKMSNLTEEQISLRRIDYNNIEKRYGYISKLSKMWNISHTEVRRFIKNYLDIA